MKERLPIHSKLAYGVGGLTDFFFVNLIQAMAVPIFAIALGFDPFLLGIALAAARLVGALSDPIIGYSSDNLRWSKGRRKPFIFIGALVGALVMPLVWVLPAGDAYYQFGYLVVVLSIMAFLHSVFNVPYGALGYELSPDYDERSSVFAWKYYVGMAGVLLAGWFYWFTLLPIFENEVAGVRWLSLIGGLVMVIGALAVLIGNHEISENLNLADKTEKSPVAAFKETLHNRQFLLIQGALIAVALGTGVDGTIGMYLHVHYTCEGDKEFASLIGGVGGTLATLSIFLAVPLALGVSNNYGKREAALFGLGVLLVAIFAMPWCISPNNPWLVVIVWVLATFGSQCAAVMYGAMVADICDEDEVKTRMRREGSYAAAGSFLGKLTQVFVLVLSGLMPRLAGYVDTSIPPNIDQLQWMKAWLMITDLLGVLVAIGLLYFYALDRARAHRNRKTLDDRHQSI